jgi:hypothetical protein
MGKGAAGEKAEEASEREWLVEKGDVLALGKAGVTSPVPCGGRRPRAARTRERSVRLRLLPI